MYFSKPNGYLMLSIEHLSSDKLAVEGFLDSPFKFNNHFFLSVVKPPMICIFKISLFVSLILVDGNPT